MRQRSVFEGSVFVFVFVAFGAGWSCAGERQGAPPGTIGTPQPSASTAASSSTPPTSPSAPSGLISAAPSTSTSASATLTPGGETAPPAATSWTGWKGPEALNSTCVKESTKELCFDAVDNDCNGQIDEGCPYGGASSALHVVIAWRANVDLDLHVVGPDGQDVAFDHRVGNDLSLDKDCHGDDCPEGNVENVYVPAGKVFAKGHYTFTIRVATSKSDKSPAVPFMFGLGVLGKSYFVPAMIKNKSGAQKIYELDAM